MQFVEGPHVFNLDKVQIYGLEVKPVFRPAARLTIGGAATYLHSEVRKSARFFINPLNVAGGPIDPVGLRLPQSPKWKANGFTSYVQPIGASSLTFGLDATYSGAFNNYLFASFPNDSYTVEIGRAHVCTPVTNAHLVCRLLLEKINTVRTKNTKI